MITFQLSNVTLTHLMRFGKQ